MVKLLIVDDVADTREILGKLVDASKKGVPTQVLFAGTLAEARTITAVEHPHLTFLDLRLPDASIDEVLASIHDYEPPVIVVSGMPATHYREGKELNILGECYAAGAEDYIEKGSERFFQAHIQWMKVVLQKYGFANA